MIIPNLAIHMSGRERKELNPQKDLLPLLGISAGKGGFRSLLAREAKVKEEQILSYDMFLYNRMSGTVLELRKN